MDKCFIAASTTGAFAGAVWTIVYSTEVILVKAGHIGANPVIVLEVVRLAAHFSSAAMASCLKQGMHAFILFSLHYWFT